MKMEWKKEVSTHSGDNIRIYENGNVFVVVWGEKDELNGTQRE